MEQDIRRFNSYPINFQKNSFVVEQEMTVAEI